MPGLEEKLGLMAADMLFEILMDIYFAAKNKGGTITAEEILAMAITVKGLKGVEMQKLIDRMDSG